MSEIDRREIDRFNAPYGKEVVIEEVLYDNGFRMLRMRVREGRRFTVIDLDPVTARHWGDLLAGWAAVQPDGESADTSSGEPGGTAS